MIFRIIFLLLSVSATINAFKILVLYPTPSISHQHAIMTLTKKLVQEGHELFVVSPNAVPGLKSSNYTYVDVSFSYQYMSDEKKDGAVFIQQQISKWDLLPLMKNVASIATKQFLSQPFHEFEKRVKAEKIKFDVVIIESYFLPHACAVTRLLSGNVPIITMLTTVSDPYSEPDLGSIQHLSYVPSVLGAYTDKMSLWQKIENWYFELYNMATSRKVMEEEAKGFLRNAYGPETESLVDACRGDVSLALLASNSLYFYPRLLAPNVVELGPLHLKQPEKLPKILQEWLDGAGKGVIYFSLGSNMKSKSLPADVRLNFLKFFKELPVGYRVLWKWESDGKIPGQSDNILAQKWIPQHSVLAHPKVRVFITQGGLQSFQETVHYGVPTVVIPWFGDQECNAAKMVDAKIGVQLLPQELDSFQKIKSAIETLLYDDSYLENMKKLSAISRDFTFQALDKAVFWVEHVARHGGASHLRPSTADTTYFQFFCLDIISVILVFSFIILYIFFSVCKLCITTLLYPSSIKIKKS